MFRLASALLLLLAGLSLAGCDILGSGEPDKPAEPEARSGPVRVVPARGDLSAPYVVGRRVHGAAGRRRPLLLASAARSSLVGTLSPAAVPRTPEARLIAYNAFRAGRPVVRLHDALGGEDSVLAEGAFSVAWRRDGALAYFKGLQPRVADPERYPGHVVVRPSLDGGSVRWTPKAGRYVVAAWGLDRLVVYRLTRKSADLLILEGPQRVRVLARDSFLVALSPDGRQAFVSRPSPRGTVVRVVDLASGVEVARLALGRRAPAGASAPITFVGNSGSWSGDLVVGPTNTGLILFRVRSNEITLDQTLEFDLTVFQVGVQEPRLHASGRRVLSWAELTPQPRQPLPEAALLDCDRITRRCLQGEPASALSGPRPLYNPSRPG